MNKKQLKWKPIETKHIIQDEWIDFRQMTYEFPDGSVFGPFYNYSRRDYVVVMAIDTKGNYICVQQFRHGIREVTTEFPAGGIEVGQNESALEAAKRELQEETGYISNQWKHLITIPSNATVADNYAHIFVATNCEKVSNQHLDASEFVDVQLYTQDEIEHMIQTNQFLQAIHVMTYYMYASMSQ